MDEVFVEVNRRAIAAAIEQALKDRIAQLQEKLATSDFVSEFYGEPTNALVIELDGFQTFYDEVVMKGRKLMTQDAASPTKINNVYASLAELGVVFTPPSQP